MVRSPGMLLLIGLAWQLSAAQAQTDPAAALPVGTVAAQRKAIDKALDFVGRVEAVSRVEVRARLNKEAAHFLRRDTRLYLLPGPRQLLAGLGNGLCARSLCLRPRRLQLRACLLDGTL